jgi:serpin B
MQRVEKNPMNVKISTVCENKVTAIRAHTQESESIKMSQSTIKTIFSVLILCTVLLTSCAQLSANAQVVTSDVPRNTSPSVNPDDMEALASGNQAFALNLYQALLKEEDGNLFYSPYSISAALAMTYAGARNETEREMAEVLHFTMPQERLHPAFNLLDLNLSGRGADREEEERGFQLNIANSLWGQRDYEFLPEFLDVLAENYGAGLRILDFEADAEKARQIINEWVSDQTEEKIKDLIKKGILDGATRLVLTNAIYFNAKWRLPFQESGTTDGSFYLLDGSQVKVPMMSQTASFRYVEGDGYQAVELPYIGDELAMVILLPSEGSFEDFERSLTAERLDEILEGLQNASVYLTMPKFEYESDFSLAEVLIEMGMPSAFGNAADFSGMDGTLNLVIEDVVHKAFVSVDEAGTEAAAATAVIMVEKAMMDMVDMQIDRPFIFVIRDFQTDTILFLGRVVNPAG